MPTSPMPASRNSGGNSALSAAHFARKDSPMKSTMAPTRATVLPPKSHAFARATSNATASGFADALSVGSGAGAAATGAIGGIAVATGVAGLGKALSVGNGNADVVLVVATTAPAVIGCAEATTGATGSGVATFDAVVAATVGAAACETDGLVSRVTSLRTAFRSVHPASAPKSAPTIHSHAPLCRDTSTPMSAPQTAPQIIMKSPQVFA